MKIINSTSMTSTNGVTLICAMALRRGPLRLTSMLFALFHALENVHKFLAEIVHFSNQFVDLVKKVIVTDDRRNRRRQTDGGRYQGFRNARGNRRQRGTAGLTDAVKGIHNSPDRTKQADKGGDRASGSKKRQIFFQPLGFLGRGTAQGAGDNIAIWHAAGEFFCSSSGISGWPFFLLQQFMITLAKQAGDRGMAELLDPLADQIETFLAPEKIEEAVSLDHRFTDNRQFMKNDRPGYQGKIDQNQ